MLSALNNTVASAVGRPQASTIELAFAALVMPAAVLAGAWLDGLQGACQAWVAMYPVVYALSNALTCRAVGNSMLRALLALAPPALAGAVMWACIAALRWQLAGDIHIGLLFVVQLLGGAVSYAAALHLLAPSLARDVRTLTFDLFHPKRAPAG